MDGVHLMSSSDAGMRYDIHPKHKRSIGERLALSALKYEYDEPLPATAPIGIRARAVGNDIQIDFAGDLDTLKVQGDHLNALQLFSKGSAGYCEVSYDTTDFTIEGSTLTLKNANMGGQRVHRICFAQQDYYQVNLYSNHHLPAMPFVLEV